MVPSIALVGALLVSLVAGCLATGELVLSYYRDSAAHHAAFEARTTGALGLKTRRHLQEGSGEVCAELCFEAPPGDISRPDPLPVLLVASSGPSISLLDCYNAAIAFPGNNITYFAIIDGGSCFGGYAFPPGWAPYDGPCSLACYNSTEACGGLGTDTTNVAAVFSMGKCEYPGAPCLFSPPNVPPTPLPPIAPPPSPPVYPTPNMPPAYPNSPPSPPPLRPSDPPSPPPNPPEFPPPDVDTPSPSPPPAGQPSPPAGPKRYRCKPGIALWGTFLPGFPQKLNPTRTTEQNTATCQARCDANAGCKGYYYKTTGWCYVLNEVFAFGKHYNSAVQACKVES